MIAPCFPCPKLKYHLKSARTSRDHYCLENLISLKLIIFPMDNGRFWQSTEFFRIFMNFDVWYVSCKFISQEIFSYFHTSSLGLNVQTEQSKLTRFSIQAKTFSLRLNKTSPKHHTINQFELLGFCLILYVCFFFVNICQYFSAQKNYNMF